MHLHLPVEAPAEVNDDSDDTDEHHSGVTVSLQKRNRCLALWKCHGSDATASWLGAVVEESGEGYVELVEVAST